MITIIREFNNNWAIHHVSSCLVKPPPCDLKNCLAYVILVVYFIDILILKDCFFFKIVMKSYKARRNIFDRGDIVRK